jgi:hypothetical protein
VAGSDRFDPLCTSGVGTKLGTVASGLEATAIA